MHFFSEAAHFYFLLPENSFWNKQWVAFNQERRVLSLLCQAASNARNWIIWVHGVGGGRRGEGNVILKWEAYGKKQGRSDREKREKEKTTERRHSFARWAHYSKEDGAEGHPAWLGGLDSAQSRSGGGKHGRVKGKDWFVAQQKQAF